MIRPIICYTCGYKSEIEEETVNKSIICPECGGYCYYDNHREMEFVQVLKVEEKIPEGTRTLKHAEVIS